MTTKFWTALSVLGAATFPVLLWKLYKPLYIYIIHRSTLPKYIHGPGEPWALVTGTTGEIGFEFCSQLAAKGFHLIIHGRNGTKLAETQRCLAALYPALQIDPLILEATASPASIRQALETFDLQSRNLTVIVNNAGGASHVEPIFKPLLKCTTDDIEGIIDLNLELMTSLTHQLLPHLIRSGPSLILNISSVASSALPYLCAYGATKSYVETFTTALDFEMYAEGHAVDAQCFVFAAIVNSNHRRPFTQAWDVPTSKSIVEQSLARIGCGEPVVFSSFPQAVESQLMSSMMPTGLTKMAKAKIVRGMKAEQDKKL